ncbi:MAG: ATP-binding protein [Alphaproteobacteria bacterium]
MDATAGMAPWLALVLVLGLLAAALAVQVWWQRRCIRTLEAETARMGSILRALPFPIWWRQTDQTPESGNPAYARVFGSRGDPKDPAEAAQSFRIAARRLAARAKRTGVAQCESHSTVVDGDRRLFEISEMPDGDGRLMVGYAIDMTSVEESQAALAAHIDAHTDVLESLRAAIAIFGPDRRLRFFNSAFAQLWRVDRALLDERPTMGTLLEQLREHGRLPEIVDFPAYKREQDRRFTTVIEPVEELVHLPSGETLRATVSPHPGGNLLFVYEDVTDRLALERSFNTLNAVQRETLNNLHEAVSVFGSDGRLRLWNPAWQAMWKIDPTSLGGNPHVATLIDRTRPFYRIEPEDWEPLRNRLVPQVTSPARLAGRFERTDGSVLDYSIVPLPDSGCLVTYIDVTDSVRVQRALEERNLALEYADKLKSQFIANVSYELRTPLNAIVGFSELLSDAASGPLNTRQRTFVDSVLQASTQLISLINDILDLATIEAGYLELHRRPVEISSLLQGLADMLESRAAAQKIDLVFDCPSTVGEIDADPTRLRQAVFNLLSNALKFTPAGGTVSLSVFRGERDIRIEVADTGAGIAPENLARVFQSFERGDPNARESGAGLGLSLTKSLVELHGGQVVLESTPGSGTRAACILPLHAPATPGNDD